MSRSFYFALFCNIKVSLHYKLSVKSIIYLKCASHSFDTMRTNVVSVSLRDIMYGSACILIWRYTYRWKSAHNSIMYKIYVMNNIYNNCAKWNKIHVYINMNIQAPLHKDAFKHSKYLDVSVPAPHHSWERIGVLPYKQWVECGCLATTCNHSFLP